MRKFGRFGRPYLRERLLRRLVRDYAPGGSESRLVDVNGVFNVSSVLCTARKSAGLARQTAAIHRVPFRDFTLRTDVLLMDER